MTGFVFEMGGKQGKVNAKTFIPTNIFISYDFWRRKSLFLAMLS